MSKRAFISWLLALFVLAVACVSTLLRLGVPLIPDISQQLLREVHARSGVVVNAQQLSVDWHGGDLVIQADDVRATRDGLNLSAQRLICS